MNAVLGGRIVAGWARNAFGMPTFRVQCPRLRPGLHRRRVDRARTSAALLDLTRPGPPARRPDAGVIKEETTMER
jgi:hypothetical protein